MISSRAIGLIVALLMMGIGSTAEAVPHSMTGNVFIGFPSAGGIRDFSLPNSGQPTYPLV